MIDDKARPICQEWFDTAVKGLAAQNWVPSTTTFDDGERCAYRGAEGTRCAVGHLIPDDQYHPEMEGGDLSDLIDEGLFIPGIHEAIQTAGSSLVHRFLWRLQSSHDDAFANLSHHRERDMRRSLQRVAFDFQLDDTILGEA